MNNIITLDGETIDNTPAPNETLIGQLETLLEDAKSGDLRSMLAITKFADGNLDSSWSGDTEAHSMEMLGQLHVTATQFATQIADIADADEIEV